MAWEDRDRFRVRLTPLDEAIRQAAQAGQSDDGDAVCLAEGAFPSFRSGIEQSQVRSGHTFQ